MRGASSGGAPQGRSTGGGVNYAMLASLGMMAYQAYQNWQRQQNANPSQQQSLTTVDQLDPLYVNFSLSVDELTQLIQGS